MNFLKTLGWCSIVCLTACGQAKKTPDYQNHNSGNLIRNGLLLMEEGHTTSFDQLPLEGTVEINQRLWSGDNWPLNRGNINRRWNTPAQAGFDTLSPTKEELLLLTQEEITSLAPSEKYDLLMGQYHYPLKTEVNTRSNPMAVNWEGIGNGWAAASSNHNEPIAKTLINPDGISIPFGSSDIKALLSYYYAFSNNLPQSLHLGLRCFGVPTEDCKNDLNAGSFHVTLANRIGLHKQSFLADMDPDQEVWNHPFQAYRSEVLDTNAPNAKAPVGTVKTLKLKTKVYYVEKSERNTWNPIKGSYMQVSSSRLYHYDLHLNVNGDIIGGNWRSGDRPDFIWVMSVVENFEGYYTGLAQLLN